MIFGFIGVSLVMRLATEVFKFASFLPTAAIVGYYTLHMLTRHIGKTKSALTISFYIQVIFIFYLLYVLAFHKRWTLRH